MSRNVEIKFNKRDKRALMNMINDAPAEVRSASDDLMANIQRIFQKQINRNPWEIGGASGGVPVDSNHLRQSHIWRRSPWEMSVTVQEDRPEYAIYVHEGTRKMEARPWMDEAMDATETEVKMETERFLDNLLTGLTR